MTVKKLYTESSIQDIADAIRIMDGDETEMLITDMPIRILALGSVEKMEELEREAKVAKESFKAMQAEADFLRIEAGRIIDMLQKEY